MGIDISAEFCPYTFLLTAEILLKILQELTRFKNLEIKTR